MRRIKLKPGRARRLSCPQAASTSFKTRRWPVRSPLGSTPRGVVFTVTGLTLEVRAEGGAGTRGAQDTCDHTAFVTPKHTYTPVNTLRLAR